MILNAKGIRKSYEFDSVKVEVLKGVDLKVERGEFVTIMGKSGSGKSTLMNILSTLDVPDSGAVHFDEMEITSFNDEECAELRKNRFGFVFQQARMVKNLSLLDNILLPGNLTKRNRKEKMNRAKELMRRMGVANLGEKKITQVSGGQLQRIGICRALINEPDILFADEPTGALDSKSGEDVIRLLNDWNRNGLTIVLVTHDIHVAAKSKRCLWMKDGILYRDRKLGEDAMENLEILSSEIHAL